ncbi:MAG: HAD-IA family hydrolase [Patescibacteria group bacterium]|nr:HAD-IA family hydrolase [Patescibacteria group bacterium]
MFDIGKTLVGFDLLVFAKKIQPYSKLEPQEIVKLVFKGKEYFLFEKGKLNREDYINKVFKRIGANDLSHNTFIDAFTSVFFPNVGIRPVLSELQKNTRLFLISNISELHWEKYFRDHPIIKDFFPEPRQQILSFQVGWRKPDRHIFQKAIKSANVQANEALFFDDKQKNIDGFKKIGGHAQLYDCTQNSIDELLAHLRNYEVIS